MNEGVHKIADERGGGEPILKFVRNTMNEGVHKIADEAGGGEPSDPPSANYDIMTSDGTNCDTALVADTITAPCLTEDELAILRKYQRTVVATDAVECKIILIGRWTLNNQYEEEAEVRV